jgi:hypothetical protein
MKRYERLRYRAEVNLLVHSVRGGPIRAGKAAIVEVPVTLRLNVKSENESVQCFTECLSIRTLSGT